MSDLPPRGRVKVVYATREARGVALSVPHHRENFGRHRDDLLPPRPPLSPPSRYPTDAAQHHIQPCLIGKHGFFARMALLASPTMSYLAPPTAYNPVRTCKDRSVVILHIKTIFTFPDMVVCRKHASPSPSPLSSSSFSSASPPEPFHDCNHVFWDIVYVLAEKKVAVRTVVTIFNQTPYPLHFSP